MNSRAVRENKRRAKAGKEILNLFIEKYGDIYTDLETNLCDMLADLTHYARSASVSWDNALQRATMHATEEIAEEQED